MSDKIEQRPVELRMSFQTLSAARGLVEAMPFDDELSDEALDRLTGKYCVQTAHCEGWLRL